MFGDDFDYSEIERKGNVRVFAQMRFGCVYVIMCRERKKRDKKEERESHR